ncbi:MAG: Type II secretion system protein F [Chlamydiae bacterium]|nr:Type II secretion system protein F [Chlamydiota bacterium]
MGLYQYTALSEGGRKSLGMINADSLELAKERLRKQKILVTKLSHYKREGARLKLSSSHLLNFTRDMHALLRAGLPLYDSLHTLEEKYRSTKMHSLFLDLCDQVKQGHRFSDSLKEYPNAFDAVYISMLRAGEESGTLTQSFEELSKLIYREHALKKRVSAALIYPAFLGCFCLAVVTLLLFFLIPSMAELFEGRSLHPMTEAILTISRILNRHAIVIFTLSGAALLSLILFFRHPRGKESLKHSLLYIPVVKRIYIEIVMARFCRVFSVLFNGSVPLLECMRLSKRVMKHPSLERVITEAEGKVIEGKRLSEEFAKSPLIPSLVVRMLSIAEESGRVAEMMGHLSTIYEENVERSLGRVTALLQPVILLLLGVIVAVILLSVLLPLTDVSSFIQ